MSDTHKISSKDIAVYIPVYNNEAWCSSFQPLPGVEHIASDNGSTDRSADILEEKGVQVIRQSHNLGRVGNWEFCTNHFASSGRTWFKWLFVGDEMYPGWDTHLIEAAVKYPEAKLIIAEFDIVGPTGIENWEMFEATTLVQPAEAMKKASCINWFGPPLSTAIHKEALAGNHRFSDLDWVADMLFSVNIAARFPTLYLKEKIGAFHSMRRNYYLANMSSPFSYMEEAIALNKALKLYYQLTNDREFYDRRSLEITEELKKRLGVADLNSKQQSFFSFLKGKIKTT